VKSWGQPERGLTNLLGSQGALDVSRSFCSWFWKKWICMGLAVKWHILWLKQAANERPNQYNVFLGFQVILEGILCVDHRYLTVSPVLYISTIYLLFRSLNSEDKNIYSASWTFYLWKLVGEQIFFWSTVGIATCLELRHLSNSILHLYLFKVW